MRVTSSSKWPELNSGMNPTDVSVAQMLELAKLANIQFEVVNARLVMRSAHANWNLWPPVRHYLDEIGVETIMDYLQRTEAEERALLSAAA